MKNSEGYTPRPDEVRSAEAHMDDRQRELTESREDSLYEGRRQEREASEMTDGLQEVRGYSKEEYDEVYNYLKKYDWSRGGGPSVRTISEMINRSEETVIKIASDIQPDSYDGSRGRIYIDKDVL